MKHSQFKYLKLKGISGAYLGSLASNKILLFIGRSNAERNSAPLQELLNRLVFDGYLLFWLESRNQSIGRLLREKSVRAAYWLDKIFGSIESPIKLWLRRLAKGLILISHPTKWDYYFLWLSRSQLDDQTLVIRRTIQKLWGGKSVFILSHSAGGIIASNIANETNLCGIICFGYPFRHPDKDEEIYRTAHLKDIRNPFLIIQGNNDEYGGSDIQSKYKLSSYIEFEFIEATHEYENLSIHDWSRVIKKIEALLNLRGASS